MMANDKLNSWKRLNLLDLEKPIDDFNQAIPEEISHREQLCLLGFVVAEKTVNKEDFKSTMLGIWQPKGKIDFNEVGFNLYILEFKNSFDLERIREGCPWSFNRNLLFLIEYNRKLTPWQVSFEKEPMWV